LQTARRQISGEPLVTPLSNGSTLADNMFGYEFDKRLRNFQQTVEAIGSFANRCAQLFGNCPTRDA
jgi:hypothetical protein